MLLSESVINDSLEHLLIEHLEPFQTDSVFRSRQIDFCPESKAKNEGSCGWPLIFAFTTIKIFDFVSQKVSINVVNLICACGNFSSWSNITGSSPINSGNPVIVPFVGNQTRICMTAGSTDTTGRHIRYRL